jgi:hypothetical protein
MLWTVVFMGRVPPPPGEGATGSGGEHRKVVRRMDEKRRTV